MYYEGEKMIVTMLLVYLFIVSVGFLFYLAGYILKGIGMYTLGKTRGMTNPWLAFIPYARTWFQGELCGPIAFKERRLNSPGIWMLVIPIVSNVIASTIFGAFWSMIIIKVSQMAQMFGSYGDSFSGEAMLHAGSFNGFLIIGFIIVLLFTMVAEAIKKVLFILVNQQIFTRYTDKNYATLHAALGEFVPLYTSIYFFIIRNRE